jgi:Spy/CpxP family protein refolding chaperone
MENINQQMARKDQIEKARYEEMEKKMRTKNLKEYKPR